MLNPIQVDRATLLFREHGCVDAWARVAAEGIPDTEAREGQRLADIHRDVDGIVGGVFGAAEYGRPERAETLRRSLLAERGVMA